MLKHCGVGIGPRNFLLHQIERFGALADETAADPLLNPPALFPEIVTAPGVPGIPAGVNCPPTGPGDIVPPTGPGIKVPPNGAGAEV